MGIIKRLIEKHREKINRRESLCDEYIKELSYLVKVREDLFSNTLQSIDPESARLLYINSNNLISRINFDYSTIKKAKNYNFLKVNKQAFERDTQYLYNRVNFHNQNILQSLIQYAYTVIGDVEGRKLDVQQMAAIVRNPHNQLIIAGAGTGKTTTIIGKIKYLLKTNMCTPEEILVVSFTNASASEMKERIQKETGCRIETSTFHKLGMNIITSVDGIVPKITKLNLRSFIKNNITDLMKDEQYFRKLTLYLFFHYVEAKTEFDFNNKAEYEEYLRLNPPVSLNKESLKSYGEMDIANFLYQNNIKYIYEASYEFDTRTSEYGQYHPDFYLPEYNIYLEYFGINRNGDVPEYFEASHGMTASQAYTASIQWKKRIHKENHTTMIECYAYEKMEGCLIDNLQKKLTDHSVKLKPKSTEELWELINSDNNCTLNGITELIETVINLMKNNEYSVEDLRKHNFPANVLKDILLLIDLIEPIFNSYESYLSKENEIDFNDMINLAKRYVKEQKYRNPYKYVIVDEYQDISKNCFYLLDSLRQTQDYQLFCVGDDWQSIYQFSGSNIDYILHFSEYWGATEIGRIETTYRFSRKLIDVSSFFIMQNPAQYQKTLKSPDIFSGCAIGEINGFTEKAAINLMARKMEELPKNSSVFVIGRYNFDSDLLAKNSSFDCNYQVSDQMIHIRLKKRKDLNICFLTAHKSKGLQADYVFIINNKNTYMGFPSKVQDSPIIDFLLNKHEKFPYAEERRLYYVAMTRARKKVMLVTVKGMESNFALELRKNFAKEIKAERYECPLCGGRIIKINGRYGEFYGCNNYHSIGCKFTRQKFTQ